MLISELLDLLFPSRALLFDPYSRILTTVIAFIRARFICFLVENENGFYDATIGFFRLMKKDVDMQGGTQQQEFTADR